MLLPSDVARLVLGYLQEEGLSATSRAFIHESPNLKEYADHTSGDGTVPACVFSIFGNGLTTILNEYVATKTKESHHEVPAVMSSLWKKLDFTLNQIKSLQNSPVRSACQRTRSRAGVANMARQRVLAVALPGTVESSSVVSPVHIAHSLLSQPSPLARAAAAPQQQQQQFLDVRLHSPRDSLTVVPEQRLSSGPMSPGRRKWDTPRKRPGAAGAPSAPSRCPAAAGGGSAEPQLEEVVDENFPQLVIQNAREKMLGDRSLQEKLAENINKILASDPVPQMSRSSAAAALEADQSIDEILGLEGEIHMSDDAIHDILEQTESDPAFQALYDLFDYSKTRFTDAEAADGAPPCLAEEGVPPSAVVRPLQGDDPGHANADVDALDATLSPEKKKAAGQERRLRKTSTQLKKTLLCPGSRSSRIENSSARLLVSPAELAATSATEKGGDAKQPPPMDANPPLSAPPPPPTPDTTDVLSSVLKDSSSASTALSPSSTPPPLLAATLAVPLSHPEAGAEEEPRPGGDGSTSGVLLGDELSGVPAEAARLPQTVSPGAEEGSAGPPGPGCSPTHQPASPVPASPLLSVAPDPQPPPTSAGLATAGSSPPLASSAVHRSPGADPGVVSLKIIISDEKEEESGSAAALNQAVSSISGDQIPTIYLSSPAKSPGPPGAARTPSDEVAQAVSGLQRSEGQASPLRGRAGTVLASPLAGTPALAQNYIIQLPLEAAAPAVSGPPASYLLVTEPAHGEAQARQVLLSAGVPKGPLPFSQYGGPTQASSPGYPTGSTLLLPSPAKPVMVPVSVMGQNAMGPVQMVSSQFVTIQKAVAVQQPVSAPAPGRPAASSTSSTVSLTFSAPGTKQVERPAQALAAENQAVTGPKHKRTLCFDSSGEGQPRAATISASPSATNASRPASAPRPQKDGVPGARTRPNILGGNRPQRRLQPVRCPTDQQTVEKNLEEAGTPKDAVSRPAHKQTLSARADENARVGSESSPHRSGKESGSERRCEAAANEDKDKSSKKEAPGKAAPRPREGRVEKKGPLQEAPSVTGNKENEMEEAVPEKQAPAPSPAAQGVAEPLPKTPRTPSKTSSLAKQAVEMLHNLQGHRPPPEPPGPNQEESGGGPRTPGRQKKAKDGEGTPKQTLPPGTPEVPSCSPVSEAGSENSINMAAHTLMILSRATIARTGTPLKDSLRQDGVGEKTPTKDHSKTSKKRKQRSPADTPPAKKDHREKKKLMDFFPRNLDVDKFLSSLHYDE